MFTNGSSITNLSNGAQSRQLVINTTIRPTPTASWYRSGPLYAMWLPVSGIALLGAGAKSSRRRRLLVVLGLVAVFALVGFQAGCGSSSSRPIPGGGTPAGTYTITISAMSGSSTGAATRTFPVTLVVQ
jgi:hypothetical protein